MTAVDELELTAEGRRWLEGAVGRRSAVAVPERCADCRYVAVHVEEQLEPVSYVLQERCPRHAAEVAAEAERQREAMQALMARQAAQAALEADYRAWLAPEVRWDADGLPYIHEGRKPPIDWRPE